jgi:hypothetical protein
LETRRFGNCRIAHVVTLEFVMCKGWELLLNLMSLLVQLTSCNTIIDFFLEIR